MHKIRLSHSGFTLIEMMIAVTIFAFMSIAVTSIYIQTSDTARRLQMTRHLTETAREITERIGNDVSRYGIKDGISAEFNKDSTTHVPYKGNLYTASGGEVLTIADGSKYIYGKRSDTGGIVPCEEVDKKNSKIQCGLYQVSSGDTAGTTGINLVDRFIPEEDRKRVRIEDLKFFISGDATTAHKVTLVFTLALTNRAGVSTGLIANNKMRIQTTFSERNVKIQ